jgi:hypothetical protein
MIVFAITLVAEALSIGLFLSALAVWALVLGGAL